MSVWEHTDLRYLFYGYSAAWTIMFGFLVRMDRRSRRLARELVVLKQMLALTDPTTLPSSVDQSYPGPNV